MKTIIILYLALLCFGGILSYFIGKKMFNKKSLLSQSSVYVLALILALAITISQMIVSFAIFLVLAYIKWEVWGFIGSIIIPFVVDFSFALLAGRSNEEKWENLSINERFKHLARDLKKGKKTWFLIPVEDTINGKHKAIPLSKKELYEMNRVIRIQSNRLTVEKLLEQGKIENSLATKSILKYCDKD